MTTEERYQAEMLASSWFRGFWTGIVAGGTIAAILLLGVLILSKL